MKTIIQNKFFDYFTERGYIKKDSSPLVSNKSDILFTNSGMVQFADELSIEESKITKKYITAQPCCRISGKHDDLNNIGYSPNHLTTFTMLGHFEFVNADIYKTVNYTMGFFKSTGINIKNLYITAHPDIPELHKIQKICKEYGLEIVYLEENTWSAGENMPWGRCVEIFYKDDKYDLEIWNFVMVMGVGDKEYNHYKLDTGGGAERLNSIINGSFDVLSHAPNRLPLATREENKIIEDHIQTIKLLSQEISPSNKKQGYILRMIIRRLLTLEYIYKQEVYNSKYVDEERLGFLKMLSTSFKMLRKISKSRNKPLKNIFQYINETYGAPIRVILKYIKQQYMCIF